MVEFHLGEFGVVAKEFGDGLGVVLLGVARDEHYHRASFYVLAVKGAEVVHSEAANFVGDINTTVAGPSLLLAALNKARQRAKVDVAAVARHHLMLNGWGQFIGTVGQVNQEVVQRLDSVIGLVTLGTEIGTVVGGGAVEQVVGEEGPGERHQRCRS